MARRAVKPGESSSDPERPKEDVASVVKKVRLTPAQARDLGRLARDLRTTESDILREGIEAARQRERRRRAVEDLIRLTEGETYRKTSFGLQ